MDAWGGFMWRTDSLSHRGRGGVSCPKASWRFDGRSPTPCFSDWRKERPPLLASGVVSGYGGGAGRGCWAPAAACPARLDSPPPVPCFPWRPLTLSSGTKAPVDRGPARLGGGEATTRAYLEQRRGVAQLAVAHHEQPRLRLVDGEALVGCQRLHRDSCWLRSYQRQGSRGHLHVFQCQLLLNTWIDPCVYRHANVLVLN